MLIVVVVVVVMAQVSSGPAYTKDENNSGFRASMPDSISNLVAFNMVSSNLFPFRVSFVVQKRISADHCFNSI